MAREQASNFDVDIGMAAETQLTENEWRWIEILWII
jgi:hypothetical protein